MKIQFPLTALLVFGMLTESTAQTAPRTEYIIQLSESTLALNPGETRSVSVKLIRSNGFSKFKAELSVPSALPKGLSARFEPAKGMFDSSTLYVTASNELKPGQYPIMVRCEMGRKLKAVVLTLQVGKGLGIATTQ